MGLLATPHFRDEKISFSIERSGSGRSLLTMEKDKPLCLPCSHLSDLGYLGTGDAAIMRRATKHRERMAVAVRFSRSRKRYERQGIPMEKTALEKAERECAVDAGRAGRGSAT
jgi:hypothetical protein